MYVCVSVQSPAFNERFEFDVMESDSYVNVCIWCHLPQKLDKQQRVVKPPRDILIGHVCVCQALLCLFICLLGLHQHTVVPRP